MRYGQRMGRRLASRSLLVMVLTIGAPSGLSLGALSLGALSLGALSLGALSLGALTLSGCRQPKTVNTLLVELRSPDWKTRRSAADDLRTKQGVPEQAIGPLLEGIAVEQQKETYGAMLITLGRSGVAEAKPWIDRTIPTTDRSMRRWAARSLKYWLIANGQLGPDQALPDGWPYGQPGFPPPLAPEP